MDELHKQLLEYLHYNPETGIFTWLKKKSYKTKIGSIAGNKSNTGYIQITFNYKNYRAHRLAWFYVYKQFPSKDLDHINRNKKDNRISNLRESSSFENSQNRNNKGYWLHKTPNIWRSKITVNNKVTYLGLFKTEEEAREAYIKAKREHHPTWSENV